MTFLEIRISFIYKGHRNRCCMAVVSSCRGMFPSVG